MMPHLELKDAVLPATVDHQMVKHLFSLLDCPEIDDQAIVRKIAALDFINRIFTADQNGKARKIFLENGIFQTLDFLLNKSTYKNDNLSLILTTSCLSLVYHLLSIPLEASQNTIPLESSKNTIPLEASRNTIPLEASKNTIPLEASKNTIPLETSQNTIPLEASQNTIPLETSQNTIPLETSQNTIPLCFLKYFLTIISENKMDSPVKLAVGCLCLLDWEEYTMRNNFLSLCGFEILLKTAKCSRRDVMIDIIKVFANFVMKANHQVKTLLNDVGILKYIVDICDMYLQKKIQFGGNVDNLLMQCMVFLNNFMLSYYRGKLEFYKLGGMKIITELYYVHTDVQFRRGYIERVLNILLYNNLKKKPSTFFIFMNRCGEISLRKRYPPGQKLVEESLTACQLQTDINLWDKSAAQIKEVKRSYQIESVVPFVSDSTHAIMKPNTFIPTKIDEIGMIACGMLNCQKNCTIYFGINPRNNKVKGIEVNRDMKDRFRLACDNIFNILMKPSMSTSSNVDVEFVPIKIGEDVIPNLCVAEILIKPYNDFFSFKNKTYFRYNSETMLINAEMLQLLVISDENKQWLRKEEKWLKKLNESKASRNIDTSPRAAISSSSSL